MSMNLQFRREKDDWVKVLLAMYEFQMYANRKHFKNEDHPKGSMAREGTEKILLIGEAKELTLEEEWDAIDYLLEFDLAKEVGEHPASTFGLTQEGLQLAHQIKTERQRRNTNIILLALTAILTVLTVVLVVAELDII